jgi:hypothetical protein
MSTLRAATYLTGRKSAKRERHDMIAPAPDGCDTTSSFEPGGE